MIQMEKADRARPPVLQGRSRRVDLPDGSVIFITVNSDQNGPLEVFVRLDDPTLYEWTTALTILITRALRAGQKLSSIADELVMIHGPTTGHFIPGTKEKSPGIVSRIGKALHDLDEMDKTA